MTHLLTPKDLDANPWAACGQTAVAALLERPLTEMHHAFPPHAWCNLKDMLAALAKLGAKHTCRTTQRPEDGHGLPFPARGLAQVFFRGPWDAPGVPVAASYKASHWIAVTPAIGNFGKPMPAMPPFIFDVNTLDANVNGGWMPRPWWEANILSALIAETKRATGGWWVKAAIEVVQSPLGCHGETSPAKPGPIYPRASGGTHG